MYLVRQGVKGGRLYEGEAGGLNEHYRIIEHVPTLDFLTGCWKFKDPHAFIEPCIVLGCDFVTNEILFPFSFNLSELVVFGVAFIAFTELDRGL